MKLTKRLSPAIFALSVSAAAAEELVVARALVANTQQRADQPQVVGIELNIKAGWHIYWVNPGDSGMATSITLKMPSNWISKPISWPVPTAFETGAVRNFGYEGKVVIPFEIVPSEDAQEATEMGVHVSWLACNEDACVPGSADLNVPLGRGKADQKPPAELLDDAVTKLPLEDSKSGFSVAEMNGLVHLTLPMHGKRDLSMALAFPETPQTLASEALRFTFIDGTWRATAKKSEFLEGPIQRLALVVDGGKLTRPIRVSWKSL